jgi:hypothetical protein
MPYKDYEKQKQNARENYYKNKERKLVQAKAYYYAHWTEKKEYRKKWIKNNPEKFRASQNKYRTKYLGLPETLQRGRAYNKIQWALHKGTLVRQPCEKCGEIKVDAHHPRGYSDEFVLDIQWLCKAHHEAEHHKINSFTATT